MVVVLVDRHSLAGSRVANRHTAGITHSVDAWSRTLAARESHYWTQRVAFVTGEPTSESPQIRRKESLLFGQSTIAHPISSSLSERPRSASSRTLLAWVFPLANSARLPATSSGVRCSMMQ